MAKKSKSKAELAEIWAKKNEICGDNPWFDKDRKYYNLRVEQILSMAKFIEKESVITKQS